MHANNHSARNLLYWVTGPILLSLTLAACGTSNTTALDTLDTAAPPPAAGSCLVGKWQLTDFTSYFDSVGSSITSSSKSDVTVTNKGVTGDAWFKFNSDGTTEVSGDNFTQSFEMTASGLDIPASVTINGTSQANYTVSADQITFNDQQAGDMKVTITIMGNETDATDVFLGQAGTNEQYLYTCTDANTLSLKVVSTKLDFAPIILTRMQ